MKPVIVFVAAFLVTTGLSTGAKYAMTPAPTLLPPKAVVDSLKAAKDSANKDSSEANSGQAPSGETSSELPHTAASRVDSGKPAAIVPATQPAATPAPINPHAAALEQAVAKAIATESAPKDTATEAAERRVSKVFTAMDPKQAAKVLEHMTDGDIHIILGYVGPRQAAAILAELNPERVAALSKLAMKPAKQ